MAAVGNKFTWMGMTWVVTWVGYDGWYKATATNGDEKKFAPDTWDIVTQLSM